MGMCTVWSEKTVGVWTVTGMLYDWEGAVYVNDGEGAEYVNDGEGAVYVNDGEGAVYEGAVYVAGACIVPPCWYDELSGSKVGAFGRSFWSRFSKNPILASPSNRSLSLQYSAQQPGNFSQSEEIRLGPRSLVGV